MLQQQPPQPPPAAPTGTSTGTTTEPCREAPPKQVAMAMERLGQAARLIADIRIGADRLLEAVFVSSESRQSTKPFDSILKEEIAMRNHFQDLRAIGRQLEESGVLSDALRSRSNSWGLHMPLVCPDGAVVAYAWKRQLAGQAGASAVDRTRLALKSFTDQKKRFFPHLDAEPSLKRQCGMIAPKVDNQEEPSECRKLEDIISCMEKEVPDMKISTFGRLAWLKRASLLPSSANDDSVQTSITHSYRSANSLRPGALSATTPVDNVAVIELFIPSVFRAIVSLHPVGSTSPDAVAFFSPDEGGSYLHPRGLSVYHVYRHITEYASRALQHFRGMETDGALLSFLRWLGSYQTLFSKPCSKCGRLLSMDRQLAVFLPPVHRSYRQFSSSRSSTKANDQQSDLIQAYHIGCSPQYM